MTRFGRRRIWVVVALVAAAVIATAVWGGARLSSNWCNVYGTTMSPGLSRDSLNAVDSKPLRSNVSSAS